MVLEHDSSSRVTPKIFLHVFRTDSPAALRLLLDLLETYENRVYFTTIIQAAINDSYINWRAKQPSRNDFIVF